MSRTICSQVKQAVQWSWMDGAYMPTLNDIMIVSILMRPVQAEDLLFGAQHWVQNQLVSNIS